MGVLEHLRHGATLRCGMRLAPIIAAALAAGAFAPNPAPAARAGAVCAAPAADPRIRPLEPTNPNIGAQGHIAVSYDRSPFGATVTADGHSVRRVRVVVERLRRRVDRHYVVWATTPSLDRVRRLGVLGDAAVATGRVTWNQFMIVVTEERSPDADRWAGPVLLTAVSPSAGMHTMRGHGIFEAHSGPC